MDQSPLVLQTRPAVFKPKVVELYEVLFKGDEDVDQIDGFWQEFFLHKPDQAQLKTILADLSAEDLVHHSTSSQQLFLRAIECVNSRTAPSDEVALETLTVFLDSILNKKYTSPSSDMIAVLAGLDGVDVVFPDFVFSLETVIRNGRTIDIRHKAVTTAMSAIAGAYHTGLVSYFISRDLFPALMKLMQDIDDPPRVLTPFILLGLIVNYNKFEFSNPYRLRLEDFVNDSTIKKIVRGAATTFVTLRNSYLAIQDDQPEGWNLGGTLTNLGFGAFVPASQSSSRALPEDEAKQEFAALPPPESAILLTTYDFAYNNKLFCFNFVTFHPEAKQEPSPFRAFLSFTSYLSQNAYRSARTSLYTCLNFMILQIFIEDNIIAKSICSSETAASVRLCRQRPPFLPAVRGDRVLATVVIDIIVDAINHNLRRRLDVDLYLLMLSVLLRLISFLSRSRLRIVYHWSELWRSCLALVKFFTQYAEHLKPLLRIYSLIDTLLDTLALSLSTAEALLPDPKSYDDLFYKIVEAGDMLNKFKEAYEIPKHLKTTSIDVLTNVSSHYYSLLEEQKGKGKIKHLSPREVNNIIKQGYDTLSIEAKEGLDSWDKYRETDHKTLVKKVTRVVQRDVKLLLVDK